jgi:fused signal recognition particle receptor
LLLELAMATMLSLPASSPSGVTVASGKQECMRSCPGNAVRFACSSKSSRQRLALGVRCEAGSQRVGFLGRLGRVIKEKAKSDIQLLFSGFSKTRENLAVVDELLTYWNLDESENILDELEEV